MKTSSVVLCKMPNGEVVSANITPDKVSGIGSWTAEEFIARFKAFTNPATTPVLAAGDVNTIMPWKMFSGMDTSDLRSIYTFLQTVKPISNKVEHFVKEVAKK